MVWYAWVWYCYVTKLHAYDFVIKGFVIKRGCSLCQTLYTWAIRKMHQQDNKGVLWKRDNAGNKSVIKKLKQCDTWCKRKEENKMIHLRGLTSD